MTSIDLHSHSTASDGLLIPSALVARAVERKVDVDRLFTHRWKLDEADAAYKLFDKQVDGKGVFLM